MAAVTFAFRHVMMQNLVRAFDGAVMVCVINEVNDRPVGNPKSKV
jgi:hypothetical protein